VIFDRGDALVQTRFKLAAQLIERFAGARPFFRRQLFEAAQPQRNRAAPAQDFDPQLFELLLGVRSLDSVQKLSAESFQGIVHLTEKLSA
jgi:hypothetical protein